MEATLARRLRTLVALPALIVALVAGGSTGIAGLQLTSAPDPIDTYPAAAEQKLLAEIEDAARIPARVPAAPVAPISGDAWREELPDPRAYWPVVPTPVVEREAEPAPKAAAKPKPAKAAAPTTTKTSQTREYRGTNHVWMPALGINKKVHDFPCARTRPPDHYIYRWWCAGRNNVYLMGHAASVMKPLHDAYVRGRLRVGMAAWYANPNGKVTKYRITQWRVVRPEDSGWAIAAQSVPSMTLQTCVGKNDQFRLVVRLVAVAYL